MMLFDLSRHVDYLRDNFGTVTIAAVRRDSPIITEVPPGITAMPAVTAHMTYVSYDGPQVIDDFLESSKLEVLCWIELRAYNAHLDSFTGVSKYDGRHLAVHMDMLDSGYGYIAAQAGSYSDLQIVFDDMLRRIGDTQHHSG